MIDEARLQNFYERIEAAMGSRIEPGSDADCFWRREIESGGANCVTPSYEVFGPMPTIVY